MAKKPDPRTEPVETDQVTTPDRDEELSEDSDLKSTLIELYKDIEKGFEQQQDRANDQMDYWDIYNCKLSGNQYYSGNSKIFLPIVHDAVNARTTRFSNQIFPQVGRYVEVTTEDGTVPSAEMSLIEHYIRKTKLRTVVVPALCRNGDVEGQYNVYASWQRHERHVAWRSQQMLQLEMAEVVGDEEKIMDVLEETIVDAGPHIEVLADSDVLILPQTAETVQDALAAGGSVTVLRRYSKYKIKQMVEDGLFVEATADEVLEQMRVDSTLPNKPKQAVDAAGIKTGMGGAKHALCYETWTELTINEERRLCRVFYGGPQKVLGCKRNPHWSDKCPVFSVPVDKVQGSAKGVSKIAPTKEVQYYANDVINEAADSSMYSMMPIVMTDPEKNPRIGSMVLSLAAVWETSPQDTQFAKFPDLWKSGFEIVASCKSQIMQTLSVSPAAITQTGQTKSKPSQADVAREQQVDILTTADAVTVIEEGILTPLVNFMIEMDHQFRDDRIMIRQFGEKAIRSKMEWVEPIQMDKKFSYRWFGVEQARNQMQIQQQVAGLNVIKSIPPDQYKGYKLNLVPLITNLCENLFGPRLAPLIFEDIKSQLTLEPQLENQWLLQGIDLAVQPMDDDPQHLQIHQQAMAGGDPQGHVRQHMQRHMMQMQLKQQAALLQSVQQMTGGGSQGQGPKPGSQPRGSRQQGPPGMAHRDQIGPLAGAMPQLRQRGM